MFICCFVYWPGTVKDEETLNVKQDHMNGLIMSWKTFNSNPIRRCTNQLHTHRSGKAFFFVIPPHENKWRWCGCCSMELLQSLAQDKTRQIPCRTLFSTYKYQKSTFYILNHLISYLISSWRNINEQMREKSRENTHFKFALNVKCLSYKCIACCSSSLLIWEKVNFEIYFCIVNTSDQVFTLQSGFLFLSSRVCTCISSLGL